MESFQERMRRLAAERERLANEEAAARQEALAELERINDEIDVLEERKEQLEAFLGLNETPQRAAHGQVSNLCLKVVAENGKPMSSGEVKAVIEREHPGMKLTSVPATLSRLVSLGRMSRDQFGRYSVV